MKYYQCKLSKKVENGDIIDVAWIPKKFAKKNQYIKIKIEGKWNDGWKVLSIGTLFDTEQIFEREYKTHRIVTDK